MKTFQSIRGMSDILPAITPLWQKIEKVLCSVAASYNYQEIRFPILEFTELFVRTIGGTTDIVEKEMYTFKDRNDDSLTLRPEGTACCVRAGIQQGLLHNQVQRLWYTGPMFRHERPQKGRLRQFHQFGVEAFGLAGPDIDAEVLLLGQRIFSELKIQNKIVLQLNTIGNAASRQVYREKLVDYFSTHAALLDDESRVRLQRNPLRILDSKNPALMELIKNAPKLLNYLDDDAWRHFDGLLKLLDQIGLEYTINPCLVRGLDYYNLTVFEWVTDALGAQGAICAGGHYDGLVEQLGGKATPAVGFALGLERLLELAMLNMKVDASPQVYLVVGDVAAALMLAEQLRTELPTLRLMMNCGDGDVRTQLRRADKSGAKVALILDAAEQMVTMKFLRENIAEQHLTYAEIMVKLKKIWDL